MLWMVLIYSKIMTKSMDFCAKPILVVSVVEILIFMFGRCDEVPALLSDVGAIYKNI